MHRDAGHGGGPPGHRHGNPEDLAAYIARMEAPDRAEWQRPDEVLGALGVRPGDTVAEVGAGPGYFTVRLSRAVGPRGRVFAVDVVPEMLSVLRERLATSGAANVTPVLAQPGEPSLPLASCRLALVVNTFHHFRDGPAFLRKLAACLAPGGRIANVDFHKRETPVGPPVEERVAREAFLEIVAEAGLAVEAEPTFLPHQYFFVLRPS